MAKGRTSLVLPFVRAGGCGSCQYFTVHDVSAKKKEERFVLHQGQGQKSCSPYRASAVLCASLLSFANLICSSNIDFWYLMKRWFAILVHLSPRLLVDILFLVLLFIHKLTQALQCGHTFATTLLKITCHSRRPSS